MGHLRLHPKWPVSTRLSNGVESGMLAINPLGQAQPETPFGDIKDSGHSG